MPIVGLLNVTHGYRFSLGFNKSVIGPGINLFITAFICSSTKAYFSTSFADAHMSVKGFSGGLRLTLTNFSKAFSSSYLTPNPNTVSVGKDNTSPPFKASIVSLSVNLSNFILIHQLDYTP